MTLTRHLPLLLVPLAAGCSQPHSKADVQRGRSALAAALDSWKAGEPADRLLARSEPVEYKDELRQTHALVDYAVGKADAKDPEVIRYPVTLKLKDRKGKAEERQVVFMVAMKSPIVVARDPYE